jgi:hypothetical protein
VDQVALFNQNNLEHFFKAKQKQRLTDLQMLQRKSWRHAGRRYR